MSIITKFFSNNSNNLILSRINPNTRKESNRIGKLKASKFNQLDYFIYFIDSNASKNDSDHTKKLNKYLLVRDLK